MNILDPQHPDHEAAMKAVGDFMGWRVYVDTANDGTVWSDDHADVRWWGNRLDTYYAVETRIIERGLWDRYYLHLYHATDPRTSDPAFIPIHANAAQRAEAAWRTIREAAQ